MERDWETNGRFYATRCDDRDTAQRSFYFERVCGGVLWSSFSLRIPSFSAALLGPRAIWGAITIAGVWFMRRGYCGDTFYYAWDAAAIRSKSRGTVVW